jgi:hypothetical protein
MCPTKERNLRLSGADETRYHERRELLGTPSPDARIYRLMPIPANEICPLGLSVSPSPSLVLAPESALGLLPSSGLSSAPVVRSVSPTTGLCNGWKKKELDYRSAFRHLR